MPQQIWQKQISAKQPAIFRAENGLELRGCSLLDAAAPSPSRLYVSVDGQRLALGSINAARPFCPVRFTSLAEETTFSCEGGALLLSGVVLDDPTHPFLQMTQKAPTEMPEAPTASTASTAPSNKKAKLEAQKVETSAASSKTAAPSPKVAPKPAAKAKEVKKDLPDKAVTQRTLPSGLRYEVLQRGNGPQAMVGKKVKVRYEGRLGTTGGRFDKGVIEKGMLKGERRRLLVPAKLGYGRMGAPPAIPPNTPLVFEVELM